MKLPRSWLSDVGLVLDGMVVLMTPEHAQPVQRASLFEKQQPIQQKDPRRCKVSKFAKDALSNNCDVVKDDLNCSGTPGLQITPVAASYGIAFALS